MYKKTGMALVIAAAFSISPAHAQSKSWTGGYAGVHGGSSKSSYSSDLDNANQFCYTDSSTTGTGVVVENECSVTSDSVSTKSSVKNDGTTTAVSLEGYAANGVTNKSLSFSGPGYVFASDALHASPAEKYYSFTEVGINDNGNTASATAMAALNILNLSTGGDASASGVSFGGHIGYNHQTKYNIVLGAELDFTNLSNNNIEDSSGDNYASVRYSRTVAADVDYISSAKLRLGYAYGDFMPYLTGGIAMAKFDVDVSSKLEFATVEDSSSQSFSENALGSVVGGGVSWRVTDGLILSGEGLYYKFDKTVDISDATLNEIGKETVTLDDIVEWRIKLSMELN